MAFHTNFMTEFLPWLSPIGPFEFELKEETKNLILSQVQFLTLETISSF